VRGNSCPAHFVAGEHAALCVVVLGAESGYANI
jgi:hypothetical protein